MIYTFAIIAFVYRCLDITAKDDEQSAVYRLKAFRSSFFSSHIALYA